MKNKIKKKGIFLSIPVDIVEYVRSHDPTGQKKITNGFMYLIKILKEKEDQNKKVG
jgi:hypothetical protein